MWFLKTYFSSLQVKVWFQNRRTKHKRQKQEEEQSSRQSDHKSGSSGESKNRQSGKWEDHIPSSPLSDDGSMVEIDSAPESPEMAPLAT
ncbi:hypothetical protein JTE90_002943 [Oedothorax gibbosus]|uniref:Homeobox domain-containing protein n=1 Tax=Oedothorax gibbosus TaxID=931172 RepID=A0AAV6UHY2_9ARAC|nr:hypothetical protein JTE90_002943 [Oedothorax gibbosus]